MDIEAELEQALRENDTEKYLELQRQARHYESISRAERTIWVDNKPLVLKPGMMVSCSNGFGSSLVIVYDIRRRDDGNVEFGVGNDTLPIKEYVKAGAFHK